MSFTRAITQFSDASCRLTDHVIDMVDIAIDVAEANVLVVVILAHFGGTSSVYARSSSPEGAQFLHQT